mmetsp:Transcript_21377/g.18499  ORF Transcript_21377/g.18499 Transcript_21377/m.18499 type:complete len:116 (+) Transcript_21377:311-658(+)|eukprot:CAMPEP_0114590964 /NCGR_PEP_ID=MMETSP0125-20121206/13120_1 /TAXON_ID=485358 ORGANISM="Aristerostoma sp., Strain ATCC 50986" /NCGR_SAMPLE_ID=MMETSP0125 /ASSEMBLY_ACC=CAM_ASM_000245 /LENGTH=115 /DNA_ID=CAMNT_0001788793 /DNA_START=385 /DNA_END=735 /DNA_ORIENTATION=-
MIGGDIHIGGHTDIFYKGKRAIKQLTASAINQKVVSKLEYWAMRIGQEIADHLKNGFSFEHHDWTKDNNFGVLRYDPDNTTTYVVSCPNEGVPNKHKEFSNNEWTSAPSSCCNIF